MSFITNGPTARIITKRGASISSFSSGVITFNYWRIFCEAGADAAFYAIGEIEMRSQPSGADLTTELQAIAGIESATPTFTKEQAFDGLTIPENAWAADRTANADLLWIGQNFVTAVDIVEIVITARNDEFSSQAPTQFSVQHSADGTNWITSWQETGISAWTIGLSRTFTKP